MSKIYNQTWIKSCALLLLSLVISPFANASGFATREQSITFLGNAYAGTSSAVQDASISYYNPAGISYLGRHEVVVSGAYNYPQVKLYDASSLNGIGDPISGVNPSYPKGQRFIPGFNSAVQLGKSFALGFSVVELFGIDQKYEFDSIARNFATTTKISTIDLSPSFSVKLHRTFYVGAALDFVKTNANIASGVAWGNVGNEAFGFVDNHMSAWTTGYHLGVLYRPTKTLRMGLVYFSRLDPKLSGNVNSAQTVDFGNPPPTQVKSTLRFPDRINFSVTNRYKKLVGMAEVEWTHWSRLKTWTMNYNNDTAQPGYINFNFRNTWRVSLGGDYNFTSMFALKAGLAYDQTPVNESFRSARLPENNRYIAALGLRFKFNNWLSLVGAYSHTFMRNFDIYETANTEALNNSPPDLRTLSGRYHSYINTYGLQLVIGAKAK